MVEQHAKWSQHRVGLIGAGIGGSLSPVLHETEAEQLGVPYEYSILELDDRGTRTLKSRVRNAFAAGYTGLNVTHPYKQAVLSEIDELSDDARVLGAVNTIVRNEGRLVGHNTDHSGFGRALRDALPNVSHGSVAVVGAGGAGSAVAYALLNAGARVITVADIDRRQAVELCDRLSRAFPSSSLVPIPVDRIPGELDHLDGVVNASPVGMVGHPGAPFDVSRLAVRHWIGDVVYRPMETALVQAARNVGCPVLDGGAMLVAQAAQTFELITGIAPNLPRMREHLRFLLAMPMSHGAG